MTSVLTQRTDVLRGSGIEAVRRIAANRGVELPSASKEADDLVAELERIAALPDPALPDLNTPEIAKVIAKVATQRTQIAAQREIAAELLPAAQSDASDYITSAGVAAVVNALCAQFDEVVENARGAGLSVPDLPDTQLASLSVPQFEARQKFIAGVAQLETLVADRLQVAGLVDEPLTASDNLRAWGSFATHVVVLSPPPQGSKQLMDEYAELFASMKALVRLEPAARWRQLFEMERDGRLRIRLARLGEVSTHAAIAVSWWDARWLAQNIYGSADASRAAATGSSLWRTVYGDDF